MQYRDGRERPVCIECGEIVYLNPVPSVAAILVREGRVLLVRRAIQPGLGKWCLPGGFIEADEGPAEAIIREVNEETGLQCKPLRIIDAGAVLKGFYGDLIVICYLADILDGQLQPGDDAEAVEFFPFDRLPTLAFRNHLQFLEQYAGHKIEPPLPC
jgi:8-oxo-dGTP diphosphatase